MVFPACQDPVSESRVAPTLTRVTVRVLCAVLFMAASGPAVGASGEQSGSSPDRAYEERTVEGWTVHVGRPLLEDHSELADRALRILSNQLFDVRRTLPDGVVQRLMEVPIWLQYRCRDIACATYHPSRRWLQSHGYNPDKAGSVDIGHAGHFVAWTTQQHSMLLHELAHAYHHQVLGYDNDRIKSAYRRAKDAGLYDEVLQWRGHRQRHYALENAKEFFAEMTEAYYGVNDFYPFVRAELAQHDPDTAALMRELWTPDEPPASEGSSASPPPESDPGSDS